ncbi:NlpC/P60 family protein [Clostridium sp. SHJSY1]|uniref:C40 family peptidase n=1 Tax=Clostridium sp. SHJSY1 TaxID=2942483 RepID=UPI002874D167|nr:NlpC/P60 family protein [Clostridium sp. SHJSY1]MDS0526201.1 NlpC/P60 family protein [Clostridium sp. SHJSY1]
MKRRIISAIIAGVFVVTTMASTIQVSAAPSDQQVQQQRDKYEELKGKVAQENEKLQAFDNQISQLTSKIDNNNKQIDDINKEVENTNKEIEQTKTDISDKEELLGKRLREIYKSGGQTDYISLIASADSLSDLISKVNAAVKLVNTDQKIVGDLKDSKTKLDEKVESLGTKSTEVQNINNDIKTQKDQVDQKKTEQQAVKEKAQTEKDKFYKEYLVPIERESTQGFVSTANNPNSSVDDLNAAISALRAMKAQLKSSEVETEVNNAIENAKKLVNEKQAAAEAAAAAAAVSSAKVNRGGDVKASVPSSTSTSAIVNYAYKFIGCPYVWGATGPSTFDCSGFTSYVYRNVAGIDIGRTTYEQINAGREVSRDELQPGDLVFPHDGHVTIYIGNGQVIHAPQTGDVIKISPIWKFWRARRIL